MLNSLPLISVIIPAYNIKDYITHCLNSVIKQTYQNIEILVIDDGSTDGTANVIDAIAQIDPRIRILSKANGGLSSARNYGLSHCHGEYVLYVDGDDIIAPNTIDALFHALNETGADVAVASSKIISSYEELPAYSSTSWSKVLDCKTALECMLYGQSFNVSAWGKLAKRELWGKHKFLEGHFYEDMVPVSGLLLESKSVAVIEQPLYGYYMRPGSITGKRDVDIKQLMDYYNAVNMMANLLQESLFNKELELPLMSRIASEYARMFRFARSHINSNEGHRIYSEIKEYIHKNRQRILMDKRTNAMIKVRIVLIDRAPSLYSTFYYLGARFAGKRVE